VLGSARESWEIASFWPPAAETFPSFPTFPVVGGRVGECGECLGRSGAGQKLNRGPTTNTGFIDGLDKRRGGRGDRDTVDALAAKLIEADPAAVRISCRVADWLGESDLVSLAPFFEGRGGMVVLSLEALTPGERRAVLIENGMSPEEADVLLREAEERGLAEFLDNPQKPPVATPRGPVGRVAHDTPRAVRDGHAPHAAGGESRARASRTRCLCR
jgi:hypothetical protein